MAEGHADESRKETGMSQEIDYCDNCGEEEEEDFEHECPMTECDTCSLDYNENIYDECPYCSEND